MAPDKAWTVHDRQCPGGLDPKSAETGGGGLATVVLAADWGDNGRPSHHAVWCLLAYDFENSLWPFLHR